MTERTTYSRVLVDTGPLVAMRNPADSQHALCVDTLKLIRPPLLSCWPVLTEAAWMLRHNPVLVRRMLKTVPQGLLALLDVPATEVGEIESLHAKYDDLSPQ